MTGTVKALTNYFKQSSAELYLLLVVTAGVFLIPLLPVGTYGGLDSALFTIIFLIHLAVLIGAVGFGGKLLKECFQKCTNSEKALIALGILALLTALLESTLPVTFRDAQIHHLAVPKWWVARGEIYSPDWHEWSHYPMLINLAYAGLMQLGVDSGPASYHWILQLLLSFTLLIGTQYLLNSTRAGAIAFFLSATLPILHRLASIPLVDCGLALYAAIAFFAILFLAEANEQREETPQIFLALLAGSALGLALSIKYNGLPFALALGLLFPLLMAKIPLRQLTQQGVFIALSALLIYCPWLIRNYHLTGNPIYPLYSNIFVPTIERPSGLPNLKPLEQRRLIYQESALEMSLLPLRIFFEGKDNQPAKFDGTLSPILALSLLALLLLRGQCRLVLFTFSLSALYFFLALFLNPLRMRYLLPVVAPTIFLTSAVLTWLIEKNRTTRLAAFSFLGLHLLFFSNYAAQKIAQEELIPYLGGKISPHEYLNERIPEFPMVEYVNQHIAANQKIYLLFTANRFSLYRPLVFSGGHYSASFLLDWIRNSAKTREPITQKLRARHIDYILADSLRAQSFVIEQLNAEERLVWEKFVSEHLKFIQEERGFSLWKVID